MEKYGHKNSDWLVFLSQINWMAVIVVILLHCGALYGVYLGVVDGKWQTILYGYVLATGTLAGAHRYYSHRSYKAKLPLRIILMILQTLTGQKTIITWAQEHRTHHKYTGTDADCANINRGFFFAHIGWLLMKPHPECEKRQKECDVSDLWADPIIRFQYNHYIPLFMVINVIIPTVLPHYLFNEGLINCFFGTFLFRYVYTLHVSFCGNSVAHIWGTKPYDKSISATENDSLIYATMGGAYHNYHHVFPFALINFWAAIGWAYDLKRVPKHVIEKRKQRTGDVIEKESPLRRYPLIDWIFGLILNASALWILFGLRLMYRYFSYQKISVV